MTQDTLESTTIVLAHPSNEPTAAHRFFWHGQTLRNLQDQHSIAYRSHRLWIWQSGVAECRQRLPAHATTFAPSKPIGHLNSRKRIRQVSSTFEITSSARHAYHELTLTFHGLYRLPPTFAFTTSTPARQHLQPSPHHTSRQNVRRTLNG